MPIDIAILSQIISDLSHIFPELWLIGLYIVVICLDLCNLNPRRLAFIIAVGIVGHLIFTLQSSAELLWGGMLQVDGIAIVGKVITNVALLLTILFSVRENKSEHYRGEYYSTLLGVLLGAHFLVMSRHFLMFFLSVEVISISSYILVYFKLNRHSSMNALRYLIFGATASAISLYGFSLLYGLTGSFLIEKLFIPESLEVWGYTAIFLTLSGILFKISIVPFHFWITDVYEYSPAPLLAFFAVVPKIAAGVGLFRILSFLPDNITINLVSFLAFSSILVGSLGALGQNSARKLFAFSSVAHAGFLVVCLISHSISGLNAFFFYAVVYVCMNYGIFYLVQLQEKYYADDELSLWKGIGINQPFLGILFVIMMISMTGLPITAGFTAKFFAFSSLWEYYELKQNNLLLVLIVVGLLSVAISLFFYLKIPYLMFFKLENNELHLCITDYIILVCLVLPLLVLFFVPDEMMYILSEAIK